MRKPSNMIVYYASMSPYEFKLIGTLDDPDNNTYEEVVLASCRNLDMTFHERMMQDPNYSLVDCSKKLLKYRIDVYARTSGTSASEPIVVHSIKTIDDFEEFIENCNRTATWSDKNKFRSSFIVSKMFFDHSAKVHEMKKASNLENKATISDDPVKLDMEHFELKSIKTGFPDNAGVGAKPAHVANTPYHETDRHKESQAMAGEIGLKVNEAGYIEGFGLKECSPCGEIPLADIHKAVNPSHYQAYMKIGDTEFQWMEGMQYKGVWKDPQVFLGAVMMQADKYLSRIGGKDHEVQEIMKAVWYLRFAAAYIANDSKPIRIADIPELLGEV